jgi:ribonuclease HI
MKDYIIYTDGAYSPSTNIGGIAFIILDSNGNVVCRFSRKYKYTSNQRMEQKAVINALKSIKNRSNIIIYSDSAYVVNTYNCSWKRKANLDLWKLLDNEVSKHNVIFIHIYGHAGKKYNELCDFYAKK